MPIPFFVHDASNSALAPSTTWRRPPRQPRSGSRGEDREPPNSEPQFAIVPNTAQCDLAYSRQPPWHGIYEFHHAGSNRRVMQQTELAFDYLCRLSVEVGDVVSMGPGPLGERRVVPILGGTFEGPGLRGDVLGGGNDWQILRRDGVLDLDARYALREQRGAVIRVVSRGYRYGPTDVLARLARGEEVDPAAYFFRTVLRFETGDSTLSWLNTTIAVASAERHARRVELRAWKLL
jgi:hypothetical protein